MKYLILLFVLFTFSTNINQKPIVASYDKGLDLILVRSDYRWWYSELLLDRQGFFDPDWIEQARPYTGYYWDSNNNAYYLVNMYATNDILFTIDTNFQYETLYDPSLIEKYVETNSNDIIYAEILYVGSITSLERVYYDPTNNVQYIKELCPISTNTYLYTDPKTHKYTKFPMDLPVYPATVSSYTRTLLTNSNKQIFSFVNHWFELEE